MAHVVVPEAEALLDKEFKVLDKGFLRRKKEGLVNRYTPVVRREKVLDASVSGVADRMFSGSFGAMASFLVSRKLSDDDIAALRRLLDEQEDRS